jgi:hypothetical protein
VLAEHDARGHQRRTAQGVGAAPVRAGTVTEGSPENLNARERRRDGRGETLQDHARDLDFAPETRVSSELVVQQGALDDDGRLLREQRHEGDVLIVECRDAIRFERDGAKDASR